MLCRESRLLGHALDWLIVCITLVILHAICSQKRLVEISCIILKVRSPRSLIYTHHPARRSSSRIDVYMLIRCVGYTLIFFGVTFCWQELL